MTEWLKVADCKSVRIFLRRFESYFLQRQEKPDYYAMVIMELSKTFLKQEKQDLNPQPMVLETIILPIELFSLKSIKV